MNTNADFENEIDLTGDATRNTVGSIARWMGWLLLLLLAITTGVHAISVTMAWTSLNPTGGNVLTIVRVGGVLLVEAFAVATAILLATHQLRAKQQPAAMAVEAVWVIFAAVNLMSSFAMEHNSGQLPQFVEVWVQYGLPVSALVMGVLFYLTLRLDPAAGRKNDEAELREQFTRIQHGAKLEVMASPQMKATIRQAAWLQLPGVIGRQMNLSDEQIAHLVTQAPRLLDMSHNGVHDIHEGQPAARLRQAPPTGPQRMTVEELETMLEEARLNEAAAGNGYHPTSRPGGR